MSELSCGRDTKNPANGQMNKIYNSAIYPIIEIDLLV